MYGLIYKKPIWYCSLSTGISYSRLSDFVYTGPYNGDGYTVDLNKIGLPIDVQLFRTMRKVGIGINGFVVINDNYVFNGGLICLQFGKLR